MRQRGHRRVHRAHTPLPNLEKSAYKEALDRCARGVTKKELCAFLIRSTNEWTDTEPVVGRRRRRSLRLLLYKECPRRRRSRIAAAKFGCNHTYEYSSRSTELHLLFLFPAHAALVAAVFFFRHEAAHCTAWTQPKPPMLTHVRAGHRQCSGCITSEDENQLQ